MASKLAIALMRQGAMDRIKASTASLLGRQGLTPSAYENLSKDPEIAVARMLEAIATDLEALDTAIAGGKQPTEPAETDEKTGLLTAVLDGNAATVAARVAEIESAEDLTAIAAIETMRGAKARKSVLAAINARLEALGG